MLTLFQGAHRKLSTFVRAHTEAQESFRLAMPWTVGSIQSKIQNLKSKIVSVSPFQTGLFVVEWHL